MTSPPTYTADGGPGSDDAGWIVARVGATGFVTELDLGDHSLVSDEPVKAGGTDAGPDPYELLLGSLASCTAMTVRMYASRKQWPLESVTVRIRDTPAHIEDCLSCETADVGPRRVDRVVEFEGPLSPEQHARLLQIADRCPVKQTLARGLEIRTAE